MDSKGNDLIARLILSFRTILVRSGEESKSKITIKI